MIQDLIKTFNNGQMPKTADEAVQVLIKGYGQVRDAAKKTLSDLNLDKGALFTTDRVDESSSELSKKLDKFFMGDKTTTKEVAQEAVTDLIITLVLGAGAKAASPIIKKSAATSAKKAMDVYKKTGSKKAAERVIKQEADAIRATEVDKVIKTPKTTVKPSYTNPKLQQEYKNYSTRFPEATQQQFAQHLQRNYPELYKAMQREATQVVKAADNVATSIKQSNPTTKRLIDEYETVQSTFKGNIDDAIKKASSGSTKNLSQEEANLMKLVRKNADELKKLADATGVKSAKEIPNLLKFSDQLSSILKNSPKYIRAVASKGLKAAPTLGVTGLSLYDLYQEYKEGGDNLLPKAAAGAAAIGTSLIPGGFIAKALYSSLGYFGTDKLARTALGKIRGDKDNSKYQTEEYKTGFAYPNLKDYVQEYNVGQSGRRYHVVGDKMYAFDTGKPVDIKAAIDDINAAIEFENQQVIDKAKAVEMQLADIQQMRQAGYNVNPEYENQLQTTRAELIKQAQTPKQIYNISDYDDSDIIEQVRKEEFPTEQPGAVRNMSFDQQLINMILNPSQGQQVTPQEALNSYREVFDLVADDTYKVMSNYVNDKSLAEDYDNYRRDVMLGKKVGNLSRDEFTEMRRLQYMQQMTPKIQETTNSLLKQFSAQNPGADTKTLLELLKYNLDVRKQNEVERSGYTSDLIKAQQADEARRHNLAAENINVNKLSETMRANRRKEETDIYQAQTGRMNAETSQREAAIKEQYLPYQQANQLGQTVMNAAMSDVPMDNFLNSNPQLFQSVFPGTVKQQSQRQQPGQRINLFNN